MKGWQINRDSWYNRRIYGFKMFAYVFTDRGARSVNTLRHIEAMW